MLTIGVYRESHMSIAGLLQQLVCSLSRLSMRGSMRNALRNWRRKTDRSKSRSLNLSFSSAAYSATDIVADGTII